MVEGGFGASVLPGDRQGIIFASSAGRWGVTSEQDEGGYRKEKGLSQSRGQALGIRTSIQFLNAWLCPPGLPQGAAHEVSFP